eukprot:gene5389-5927_t
MLYIQKLINWKIQSTVEDRRFPFVGQNEDVLVTLKFTLSFPSNKARSVASASLPLVKKSSTSTKGDSVTNKVEEGVSSPSADNIAGADISMRNVRPFNED